MTNIPPPTFRDEHKAGNIHRLTPGGENSPTTDSAKNSIDHMQHSRWARPRFAGTMKGERRQRVSIESNSVNQLTRTGYEGNCLMTKATITAEPFDLDLDLDTTALMIIDMQRDFVEPHGFGELLGNDVSMLRSVIEPTRAVLDAARAAGMLVIHTREGHRPDLTDCPPAKLTRGGKTFIGTDGPLGRILVRGEKGHDIIPELYPIDGEPIIDKPGKGAFYETDLQIILENKSIKTLLVCGVTTEVCIHTTVREANDRGYECVVLADCVGSYFPEFQDMGLKMIKAQGGIFGWVSDSKSAVEILDSIEQKAPAGAAGR